MYVSCFPAYCLADGDCFTTGSSFLPGSTVCIYEAGVMVQSKELFCQWRLLHEIVIMTIKVARASCGFKILVRSVVFDIRILTRTPDEVWIFC